MSTIMGLFSIAVFIVLFYDMILGIVDTIKCLNPKNVCTLTCNIVVLFSFGLSSCVKR